MTGPDPRYWLHHTDADGWQIAQHTGSASPEFQWANTASVDPDTVASLGLSPGEISRDEYLTLWVDQASWTSDLDLGLGDES